MLHFSHRFIQVLPIWVVVGRVLQDLSEQQRVFHQPAARDVQEVPQVQLPAKRGLEAALQKVLNPPILLLLVQQVLGFHLVTAVRSVGGETRQLQVHRNDCLGLYFVALFLKVNWLKLDFLENTLATIQPT